MVKINFRGESIKIKIPRDTELGLWVLAAFWLHFGRFWLHFWLQYLTCRFLKIGILGATHGRFTVTHGRFSPADPCVMYG